jgi:hypothetical protein
VISAATSANDSDLIFGRTIQTAGAWKGRRPFLIGLEVGTRPDRSCKYCSDVSPLTRKGATATMFGSSFASWSRLRNNATTARLSGHGVVAVR